MDCVGQLRVFLDDLIAVMAVQDRTVPNDERRKDRPVRQDVLLQQGELILCQRRYLVPELRVDDEPVHQDTSVPTMGA